MRSFIPFLLIPLLLTACSDWLGDKEEPPLPGERISLQSATEALKADAGLEEEKIMIPPMPANAAWPQALGNATGVSGNLAFSEHPQVVESVAVGEGAKFVSPLLPVPVVADGMVFAMDGAGVISAHHADELGKIYWQSRLIARGEEDENALLGGGLAWAGNTLFAVSDEGAVAALNATDGSKRWVKELKLPLRSAPRVAGKLLLVLTADNQLLALRQSSGEMVWSHRGISEIAGKLHTAPPAVRDGTVLVSYSSGEIVALELENGNPLWNDNLAGSGPSSADPATFSTVSPVMANGLSFTGSSAVLAAFESDTGRRLWDRKIASFAAPWLAGNYLFTLTPEAQVAAVRGMDGVIAWVQELPGNKTAKHPPQWYGPLAAGNRVWVVNNQGQLLALNPQTGKIAQEIEVPEGILAAPVIAGETMYLLSQDAKLTRVK